MNLLLDTHALLWMIAAPERLGARARAAITDVDYRLHVSQLSFWEIGIKISLDKLVLRADWPTAIERALVDNQITVIDITLEDAARLAALPFHHRDPFDRMLISQAMGRGMRLVSRDRAFAAYGVEVVWD
ncbi:MAG: type II toxin-antitoxin system VapC family toxin [Candidatus Dadabacteria bacterium]|nr:MAG: type II toxin-antitoxin system VapC family toxin [Candidatus Dadabacteria bacterium]